MKKDMEATKPQDSSSSSSSSSSSKRHFHWTNKVGNEEEQEQQQQGKEQEKEEKVPNFVTKSTPSKSNPTPQSQTKVGISRLRRAVLTALALGRNRSRSASIRGFGLLGHRVIGTLFGSRRGHVHLSFQRDATSAPSFVIELATPISGLVKEMASGLVRIALECDKSDTKMRLLEERIWRTYCNGKKCGFANRRECGPNDLKILKAVEPITMGAGVLPFHHENDQDQIMYMRAKFERIVGSTDSEAFYMMNPDSNGAPELSIYLLRL